MASSTEQLFTALLRSEHIKDHLFPHLSTSDLCAIRSTSSACCNLLTKRLFTRIQISFSPTSFTKQSRVNALARIGHHVEHVTFYLPHSEATFLPPLIHPVHGNEISFLYSPHTSMSSVLTRRKYANTELGEILTQQYPPLFHAATNVPSFIQAFKALTKMRHLTIRCPGQDIKERYRRNIVDYALISLRIAIERAPLERLNKISLSSLHPGAFNYLRHVQGFGTVPSAGRRWRQIKKLSISVEAWDFSSAAPGLDHLKMMDDYIRTFADNLEKFSFTWVGHKGPCPIALSADPLFSPPRSTKKLFHEVTSPMSPLPTLPQRSPVRFPKLRYLQIRNATMSAPALKDMIQSHRDTVKEFDFESVALVDRGSWTDALSPVDKDDAWSRSSFISSSEYSIVTNESADELPTPSAAVEAASRELLDVDLGGFGFSDEERDMIESLASEVPTARDSSEVFTTKLKKRSRRRRKQPKEEEEQAVAEKPSLSRTLSNFSSRHLHKPSRPYLRSSKDSDLRPSRTPSPIIPQANVSAPILISDPHPVLLQPTVYNPSINPSGVQGISSVQRNIEQEEKHRRLAEDAVARTSALQKAKEAVLMKLSREFSDSRRRTPYGPSGDAVAACRLMSSREFMGCGVEVLEDRRGLESRSALVPLMFSRY